MRRSQMVEILREAVFNHMNCDADCCQTDEELYSKVLKELEDAGMLPPRTVLSHLKVEDNAWDPESSQN